MRVKVSVLLLLLTGVLLVGVGPVVGKTEAPDFTLTDIYGTEFSLSDYRGRVVLIDLFRIQPPCPPCIYAIPHLKGVYNKYSQNDLVIMSISVSSLDTAETIRSDFAEEYDIPWIVACGGTQMASKYSVSGVPTLVIVDAEGYVRYRHEGVTEELTLTSEIDYLFSEPQNGEPNGDSDGTQPGLPLELVGIIGAAVISILIIGIVVAGRTFQWSKPAKKRRKRRPNRLLNDVINKDDVQVNPIASALDFLI
ncbi:Thiol-disulfide oxidoreductase ResA [subsurface metagenome]